MRLPIPDNQHLHGFDINEFLKSLPAVSPKPPVGIASTPIVLPTQTQTLKPTFWDTVQQIIPVVVTGVAAAKNQKRIDKFQDSFMAAKGRAPTPEELDRYMDATAPVVKVKGGVDNNTSKNLLIGGGLVAAALLFIAMKKSK